MPPGLLRVLAHNAGHRNPELRLFEVGRVFHPPRPGESLPDEREQLAAALDWARDDASEVKRARDTLADSLRLQGVELGAPSAPGLHPGRPARVVVADK